MPDVQESIFQFREEVAKDLCKLTKPRGSQWNAETWTCSARTPKVAELLRLIMQGNHNANIERDHSKMLCGCE